MKEREQGERGEKQAAGPTPPDLKPDRGAGTQSNRSDQPGMQSQRSDQSRQSGKSDPSGSSGSQAAGTAPATDQAAHVREPDAVAAGPGNQVQDNETRPAGQSTRDDLQPGALPDGTASVDTGGSRNEDVEQVNESRAASGIE